MNTFRQDETCYLEAKETRVLIGVSFNLTYNNNTLQLLKALMVLLKHLLLLLSLNSKL